MKIAIRADASVAIGSGHVRRCLALAEQARSRQMEVIFVARELGVDTAAIVEAAGFDCVKLPRPAKPFAPDPDIAHADWAGVSAADDAAETVAMLSRWSPDWIVIDHYGFDARWHDAVRGSLGCRIAAVDDLADRRLAVDLLVDHNMAADHADKYAGLLHPETRILGGPRFALLGPAYAAAPRYQPSEAVRSIGIFMGGVDAEGLSTRVIEAIDHAGFDGAVEIVSTRANPRLAALDAAASTRPATEVTVDLPDLVAFYGRHDLQIGAGGGATWERCCIGVPALALVVAENQRSVVRPLAEMGVVAALGDEEHNSVPAIADAIGALIADPARRLDLAMRSRALVDGHGAARVVEALAA